jgi:hypothetical protein
MAKAFMIWVVKIIKRIDTNSQEFVIFIGINFLF